MPNAPTESVSRSAARGAAWNVGTSLATRVVSVVGTLVVTRYLAPDEYGEVIGSVVVTQTCLTLSQLGLLQYLVVKPDSGPRVAFHITLYTNVACAFFLAVAYLLREPAAAFFNVHQLGHYLPWLSITALAESVSVVPERVLYRELRFRVVALTRAAGDLVFTLVSVGLARAGHGGMSLVYAGLARLVVRTTAYLIAVDWRTWLMPCALRWSITREIFGFGLPLAISNIAGVFAVRWDNMVTSRYFGVGTMGLYNLAYSLSEIPVSHVGEQIGDVLLPSFARLSPAARRVALGRSMALLGLIVFPLGVGLASIAESLVRAIFDAKWHGVAPILSILAVLAIARPISYVVSAYLQADARVVAVSVLEVVKVALLFSFMVLAAPHGILPMCAAVGTAFLVHALAGLFVVTRGDLPFWATLAQIGRPLLSTAPMAAAVLGARWGLAAAGLRSPALSVVLEIVVGAVVYVGSAFLIAGNTARELVSLARGVVSRRRGAA